MTYASKQNMIDRYEEQVLIELTDRAVPQTNAIVDAVLNQSLADADALINTYLAGRYSLPFSTAPDVLRRHACAIAFYDLHRGRYPDEVRKDFEDTLKFLVALGRGEAKLDAGGLEPDSSPAEARVEGPQRMFNRTSLEGY